MAEFQLIEIIKRRCALERDDVRLGIGDDAAVVAVPAGHELVVCTDTLVAGVHFPLETDPADIGWKSLAVNLSDLAAMGATPAWATLALTLPSADAAFVERFAEGFAELAGHHDVALIGGDTTRGPLSISVTALGYVLDGHALHRQGAESGHVIFVTGTLGDAAAGLRCLTSDSSVPSTSSPTIKGADEALITRLNRPQPRIEAGACLGRWASACIDVSDGLLADLGHIATCSNVGMEIGEDCLPASEQMLARFPGETGRGLQFSGGDDYELAFTIAESRVEAMLQAMARTGCRVTRIGRVIEGSGVQVVDRHGVHRDVPMGGWEHFT